MKNDYREGIDLLRSRANLLSGKDKVLMKMYLENGNTFYQMANLIGVNEVTIARRIHKIIERLIDSEYIICLRHRDKLTEKEMHIAKAYFMGGLSIREIASKQRTSIYRIRAALKKVHALVELVDSDKQSNPTKQTA